MWVSFKYHTARTAECRKLVEALGCHPPVVEEGASRAQLATTIACFKTGLSFFNSESSTTEDNNIFCFFFSLHPSNCETSTTGDNQSLLQVQLKFFWTIESSTTEDNNNLFIFFYPTNCETSTTGDNQNLLQAQLIVKLAQLRTTRAGNCESITT